MSLINEALKKVQRIQHEEPAAAASALPYPVAPVAARRGKPNGAHNLVLLGAGALVLVVLSVFFTVYLVNRPSDSTPVVRSTQAPTAPTPASATTTPLTHPAGDSSTPAIVSPIITPPAATPSTETVATTASANAASTPSSAHAQPLAAGARPASAAAAGVTASPPATASAAPVSSISAPPPTSAATTTTAAPSSPTASDERVAAFVEAVRVTGIRSSGTESRVLMNERVYRVNDVVERTLGVRLIKAEAEALTFSDSRGVIYEKRF